MGFVWIPAYAGMTSNPYFRGASLRASAGNGISCASIVAATSE